MYYPSYQNMSRSACRPPQIPFHRVFLKNKKGPGTNFQAITFVENFDKYFPFALLHKLAQFHCQTMFTSHVVL